MHLFNMIFNGSFPDSETTEDEGEEFECETKEEDFEDQPVHAGILHVSTSYY